MKETILLSNGVIMPCLIQGIPLAGPSAGVSFKDFERIVHLSIECGVRAFDTSAAYGLSEEAIGKMMPSLNRSELFITTKISNYQQRDTPISDCVSRALKLMKTDYIDCMLLHWPVPGYEKSWKELEKEFKKGTIRSIGIANTQERHVRRMLQEDISVVPHVMQTEIHPLRTEEGMITICRQNGIALHACSSLMGMRPMLMYNEVLNCLAKKYGKTISQIVLRWHVQRGIAPVFRAFKENHLRQSADIFGFCLSDEDMGRITALNQNYRLHLESMNCPGY